MAAICGKWQAKVQNIRLAVTPLLSRISCMNDRRSSSSSSSSYQPKPVDMEMSNSALRAKSAREHRLKVRRLKIAETIKNQKSGGQDGSPGPKRRREENVHLQPMMPASSSSLLVEAINGRDYRITVGPRSNCNDNNQLPSHGGTSVCGRRREMEDTLTLAPHFIGPDHDFFGVYDGHGGSAVAEACAARLHHLLLFEMQTRWAHCGSMRWEEVMEACFLRMDNEVRAQVVGDEEMMVGSTAVVAVVGPRYLIVANCGDSRAVLSRGRQVIPLSNDHKPNRPDELERIEAAGGRVICWDSPRVLGVLATSRSIGDHYLKPYVIPNPDVVVIERTELDEFMILASDGLWDVISNETACSVVWRYLIKRSSKKVREKVGGPVQAASMLVELAVGRGSGDNISVVVVDLRRRNRSFLK